MRDRRAVDNYRPLFPDDLLGGCPRWSEERDGSTRYAKRSNVATDEEIGHGIDRGSAGGPFVGEAIHLIARPDGFPPAVRPRGRESRASFGACPVAGLVAFFAVENLPHCRGGPRAGGPGVIVGRLWRSKED
jgi:hypothetical protein